MAGTVLVTGASGSVGAPLLDALRAAGWRSRALVHRRPVKTADATVAGDLADVESLDRAVEGVDAVLHLAALTHARRARHYMTVNAHGTGVLAEAFARSSARRLVLVGTRAVSPRGGAYSVSKLGAEDAVHGLGERHAIVRLPEVYGAGSAEGVDGILARAASGARIPVVGRGEHEIRPVLLDDVLGPLVAALDAPAAAGRTYTLGGEATTVRGFAEACQAEFGAGGAIVGIPARALAAASMLARVAPLPVYPDQLARLRAPKPPPSKEAGEDLGFRPRPLSEGLAAVHARGLGAGPRPGAQATEHAGAR